MPDLNYATQPDSKVAAGRREGKSCGLFLEGEVMYGYPPRNIGENSLAIFVNGKQKVAAGGESDASDILPMSEGKSVRLAPIDLT